MTRVTSGGDSLAEYDGATPKTVSKGCVEPGLRKRYRADRAKGRDESRFALVCLRDVFIHHGRPFRPGRYGDNFWAGMAAGLVAAFVASVVARKRIRAARHEADDARAAARQLDYERDLAQQALVQKLEQQCADLDALAAKRDQLS